MSGFHEGDLVEYRPGGGCRAERGFVTSSNDRYVFVRFGTDTGSKAVDPRDLTRVRVGVDPEPPGAPTREERIAAAKVRHDATGCGCDPKYLMSCPRMAQAILAGVG